MVYSVNQNASKLRLGVFYTVYYLLIGAVFFRMIPHYLNTPYQWIVIGLLFIYLALFESERLMTNQSSALVSIIFLCELAIILALLIIPSATAPKDYFINLVLPLCGQAMWKFPEKIARKWIIAFCLFCMISMLAYYQSLEGLSFGFAYVAGCLLIAVLSAVTLRADQARNDSQALLGELQVANRKLQDYALQVETLAAAEERNRLARELHDSVSQTIFSINLTAQSAKILLERDPQRVAGLLDHLQSLSQDALGEMRSLIQHLRPHSIVENGIAEALKNHANERFRQDGLTVDIQVIGEGRLPEKVEEVLFRVAQESLNNVVKHANTEKAFLSLKFMNNSTILIIEDYGAGFDINAAQSLSGHMGLSSMKERVASIGGSMIIESELGQGTRIKIEITSNDEGESSKKLKNQGIDKEKENANQ
jgi:signal transduction histidine kinase